MSIAALSLLAACEISTGAGEDGFGYEPKGFTVTFNSNGGSPVSPITGVKLYSTISEPDNPIKGYVFEGWYLSDDPSSPKWNFAVDVVISNITLYAHWGGYGSTLLNIGDTGPGGGIIFYKNATAEDMTGYGDFHYLEVAPGGWSGSSGDPLLAWASSEGLAANSIGTETGFGKGRNNTTLILVTDANAPAALACRAYRGPNNKDDWFLPSKNELNQLYINKNYVGLNDSTKTYWSSSEYSTIGFAQDQYFGDGTSAFYGKIGTSSVRPIRAF